MSHPGFWNDQQSSNKLVQELKGLKAIVDSWQKHKEKCRELEELIEISGPQDQSFLNQIKKEIDNFSIELVDLELKSILSGEFDIRNAIISINAGAGGTESCDWVSMLLRMYTRWSESKGYKIQTTDMLPGEEAGIKNVTLRIIGDYAYGYLKAERGVHRLVRISPFDSNKRRHTSFASVDVIPEVTEDIKLDIKEEDLRIDTYRSSGAGGQHVNVTDSAVRITHIPTGLVVTCQNERSQHQNKETAMNILKARLYELERRKKEEKLTSLQGVKQKIEWGSQIRSYVMQPYQMVKDHRTDIEVGNVQAVLDGDIEMFIAAYLKKPITNK
jgi:peptide chain release factor 2